MLSRQDGGFELLAGLNHAGSGADISVPTIASWVGEIVGIVITVRNVFVGDYFRGGVRIFVLLPLTLLAGNVAQGLGAGHGQAYGNSENNRDGVCGAHVDISMLSA